MTVMPVAAFLKDFSESAPELLAGPSREEQAVLQEEAVAAAREEGRQAGLEEAMADLEARIAAREGELQAEFEQRLAAARDAWVANESKVLADAVKVGLDGLHDAVMTTIAQVMKPFLVEQVRQKALGELAVAAGALLAQEPDIGLEIVGPSDLVKALELKLSDHAGAVSFASANFCEVEVKAGQAVLTTRIGAWLAKIDEACP